MANFPQQVVNDINAGKDYFSDLNAAYIADLKSGCDDCTPKDIECLMETLRDLEYKLDQNDYDAVSQSLYERLMFLMGGNAFIATPPSVNAGADRSAATDVPQSFTATIIPGSASIVSILWEQISGAAATLTGTTTATLGVSNFSLGNSVFRITVMGADSLTGTDTVTLTGIPQTEAIAYWGSKLTGEVLTYSQILAQGNAFTYTIGAPITVPLGVVGYERWWFAIPSSESILNYYEDTVNPLNKGAIGTDQDLIGAPTLVTGATNLNFYQNVYPIPQPNSIIVDTI